jgi:ACS family glucarate transporter-like MFS transporter
MGLPQESRPTRVRYLVLASLCAAATLAYVHRSCIAVPAQNIQFDLDLSKDEMARIMSAFYLGYTIFQIPGGWLGDRWGTRLALSLFILCWSAATGLMGLGGGALVLAGLWFINGVAQAGIFASCVNSFAHWFPPSERGFPSGMLGSFMSVGAVLATAVTGFLLQYLDWQTLFGVLAFPGVLFGVLFFLWFRDRPSEHAWVNNAEMHYICKEQPDASEPASHQGARSGGESKGAPAPARSWSSLAFNLPLVCVQQFFRAAAYIFYVTWFPNYLQESRGMSAELSGVLGSIPLLGVILGNAASGLTIDWIWRRTGSRRLSRQGVGLVSITAAGIFLCLAATMDDVAAAVTFITASAVCAGFSGAAGYVLIIDLAGRNVATLFSIMNMAGNFGATVCPLVVGRLIANKEWSGVLLFLGGLYLSAALCWCFLNIHKARHTSDASAA